MAADKKRVRIEIPMAAFPELHSIFDRIPQKSQGFFIGMLLQAGLQSDAGRKICGTLHGDDSACTTAGKSVETSVPQRSLLGDFE